MAFCNTMRDSRVGLTRNSWKTENFLCSSDESYLRSRNQGDLSKADELSATIPWNSRVRRASSLPPDGRAWQEQRLGVNMAHGNRGAGSPHSLPPAVPPLYPSQEGNSTVAPAYSPGGVSWNGTFQIPQVSPRLPIPACLNPLPCRRSPRRLPRLPSLLCPGNAAGYLPGKIMSSSHAVSSPWEKPLSFPYSQAKVWIPTPTKRVTSVQSCSPDHSPIL